MNENIQQDNKKDLESNVDNVNDEKKKRRILKVIAIIAIILLILLLAFSCQREDKGGSKEPQFPITTDGSISLITDDNNSDIQEVLNKKVEENMVNISINTAITVDSDSLNADLMLTNKKNNNYSQFVEIYDSSENLIYKSKLIPVGSKIDVAKFDKHPVLPDDKCTAYIYSVDAKNQLLLGKVGVNIRVVTK